MLLTGRIALVVVSATLSLATQISSADAADRMNLVLQRRRLLWIAERPGVQKTELGLAEADADKIKALCDEVRASLRETIGDPPSLKDMSDEERVKTIELIEQADRDVTERFMPRLKQILTAAQLTRLKQIDWQQAYVLDDPQIVEALSLSQYQRKLLQVIDAEHKATLQTLFISADIDTIRGSIIPVGNSAEERRTLFEEFQAKINNVLTKEQQEKLKSLRGKEFDIRLLSPIVS